MRSQCRHISCVPLPKALCYSVTDYAVLVETSQLDGWESRSHLEVCTACSLVCILLGMQAAVYRNLYLQLPFSKYLNCCSNVIQ